MQQSSETREPLDDNDAVTAAIRRAVHDAIEEHYRAGNSITIWRDGRKDDIPPEEIPALLAEAYPEYRSGTTDAAARDSAQTVPAPER